MTVAQSDNPTVAPTVTFLPVADAYVSSNSADQNYGSDPLLKSDSDPAQEAYLRFALSGLAPSTRRYCASSSRTGQALHPRSSE